MIKSRPFAAWPTRALGWSLVAAVLEGAALVVFLAVGCVTVTGAIRAPSVVSEGESAGSRRGDRQAAGRRAEFHLRGSKGCK